MFYGPFLARWVRICLPRQESQVWSLVWENLACQEATTSDAPSTEPRLQRLWDATAEAHTHRACAPQREKPLQGEAHTRQWEGAPITAAGESPSKAAKTQHSRELKTNVCLCVHACVCVCTHIYSITFMMEAGGICGESWNGSSEIIEVGKICHQITTVLKHFLLSET